MKRLDPVSELDGRWGDRGPVGRAFGFALPMFEARPETDVQGVMVDR
jgi:hypothetical protein